VPTIPTPPDEARGVRAVSVFVRNDTKQLKRLVELVDRGELRVNVPEHLPLSELANIHATAAAGQLPGRVVVTPNNTNN
jgi:NADPH:quinone reductase-like Zn-dependent oxidoreductase